MSGNMDAIRARLLAAQRPAQLCFLACAINEVTVRNRYHYGAADSAARLMEGNEAIHRLAGHLRGLTDPAEELTESRADGICEQLWLLTPAGLYRCGSCLRSPGLG